MSAMMREVLRKTNMKSALQVGSEQRVWRWDPRKTLLLVKEGTEMEMSSLVQDAVLSLKIVFNFKEFFF